MQYISLAIGPFNCPVQGQELQWCQTCPATCSHPHCTQGSCTFGCGCPDGQVVNTAINKCVNPEHCH